MNFFSYLFSFTKIFTSCCSIRVVFFWQWFSFEVNANFWDGLLLNQLNFFLLLLLPPKAPEFSEKKKKKNTITRLLILVFVVLLQRLISLWPSWVSFFFFFLQFFVLNPFCSAVEAWTQQGAKPVGTGSAGSDVYQGRAVSLSSDGNTLAVGGFRDNSLIGATWIFSGLYSTLFFPSKNDSLCSPIGFVPLLNAMSLLELGNTRAECGGYDCAATATCAYTTGSMTCSCNAGYQGNGTFCDALWWVLWTMWWK